MPFITLGSTSELQIVVPTVGSTDWGDTLRTDTFLKIAEHNHSGSGNGAQIGGGSLAADSITGLKIRLDNDEYLKARNNADTANVNIVKVNTGDDIEIASEISKLLLKNDTHITARNNADNADLNVLKLNASDRIEISQQVSILKLVNDVALAHRNNADDGDIDTIKINTSDQIVLGAEVVSVQTDSILRGSTAITLTDNTSVATDAGVVTLAADEACEIKYRIVRNGDTQVGTLKFTDADTIPSETYSGVNAGVTFSVNAGALEYTTTSTGQNASLYVTIIK